MYKIETTNKFNKDLKKCIKRNLEINALFEVMKALEMSGTLDKQYKAHKLSGNFYGNWECHIRPDWLLLWEQDETTKTILFKNTGTHSDIFG